MITTLDEVLRMVRLSDETAFVAKYPHPALTLWVPDEDTPLSYDERTLQSTLEEDGFSNLFAMATGRNRVGWLVKSSNNFFANIISVGRAPTNDLQIPLETISKVHAVFTLVGTSWRVSDRGAKNGLYINHEVLPSGSTVDINNGDIIKFGREVEATFYTAKGLYSFLTMLT